MPQYPLLREIPETNTTIATIPIGHHTPHLSIVLSSAIMFLPRDVIDQALHRIHPDDVYVILQYHQITQILTVFCLGITE
ncbi:unnamed protein product [Trichobilharzia regenti]|nr:unnamed protein product [Trichobilharzia regenti]